METNAYLQSKSQGGPSGPESEVMVVLETVLDPEVPVLNVVEMGIVRRVERAEDGSIRVDVTPTYTGCPAMHAITMEVGAALKNAGYANATVRTVVDEVWTTDWMTPGAREKLRAYGIAPPDPDAAAGADRSDPVPCPFCRSGQTELQSFFGSTACKSMHFCRGCQQPFEHFKCH